MREEKFSPANEGSSISSAILYGLMSIFLLSCKQSSIDYAAKWSSDVKRNILKDVSAPPDSVSIDTSNKNRREVTLYHQRIRTKLFGIKASSGDTFLSVFFSKDQHFELIRELCPAISRSFEGIRYKGKHLGLAEFRFCNGRLKEQGYRWDDDVGVWREWDAAGKLIQETDHGHAEQLDGLRNIEYGKKEF